MDNETPRSEDSLSTDEENNDGNDSDLDFKTSARLKYDEICETLDNEEKKIMDLERRRKQLQLDMEKLQREIEDEKLQFQEAIEFELENNNEDMNNCSQSSTVDVFNFDKDDITTQLDDFRQHLEQSREQNSVKREDDDDDLRRFKSNLLNYKKGLDIPEKEKITKDKRKESARLFQRHLKQVKDECSEKIEQLQNIQKGIDNFSATEDEHRQL